MEEVCEVCGGAILRAQDGVIAICPACFGAEPGPEAETALRERLARAEACVRAWAKYDRLAAGLPWQALAQCDDGSAEFRRAERAYREAWALTAEVLGGGDQP